MGHIVKTKVKEKVKGIEILNTELSIKVFDLTKERPRGLLGLTRKLESAPMLQDSIFNGTAIRMYGVYRDR